MNITSWIVKIYILFDDNLCTHTHTHCHLNPVVYNALSCLVIKVPACVWPSEHHSITCDYQPPIKRCPFSLLLYETQCYVSNNFGIFYFKVITNALVAFFFLSWKNTTVDLCALLSPLCMLPMLIEEYNTSIPQSLKYS